VNVREEPLIAVVPVLIELKPYLFALKLLDTSAILKHTAMYVTRPGFSD